MLLASVVNAEFARKAHAKVQIGRHKWLAHNWRRSGHYALGMSNRRQARESAVLREVTIKRNRSVDLEVFHQGKRCAIRIAETFVCVASKDGPSSQFVFWRHSDKSCDLLVPQPIGEPHGYRVPKVFPHVRHGFVQDICARKQKVARPLGESNRVGIVLIISIEKCIPLAGIHKDKGGRH